MGGNIPGGNFPAGGGWGWGDFPGRSLMGGNFPGESFPGGNFPKTMIYIQQGQGHSR